MGARPTFADLTAAERRRLVAGSLLRSLLVSTLLVTAYYLVPLDAASGNPLAGLLVGLALVVVVLAWQVHAIGSAEFPRLRAIGAVALGLPLLLVLFAAVYAVQSQGDPASFTEPLDRTDALYFTVTIFATVGFGDIAPLTAAARIMAMVQMVLDVVAVGVVAKLLVGAVDLGLRKKEGGTDRGAPD
jgi:voltage-gated potassium channel